MSTLRIRPLSSVSMSGSRAATATVTRLPVAHADYSVGRSCQRRAKTGQRPPCADVPDNWDLDAGTPEAWHAAVRTCLHCPLLTQCQQLAQNLIDRGDGPRAMIWAGVAYDNAGHVVVDLDRHRTVPLDHKRPMRIIRNGARPTQVSSAPTAPRRHLVLGQPLRATGTDG